MRYNAGQQKNWIMRIACVLLVMVLISMQLVSGLYARFAVEGSGGDSARAAAFVFETQEKESSRYLDLNKIKKPGDSQTYTFIVSNRNGNIVSEAAESYSFTVQLNGSMPLICNISKEDSQTVLEAEISETTQSLPVTETQTAGTFEASEGRNDTYTLTVSWPEEKNDIKFASRSAAAEVLLTITAEQID